MRSDSPPASWYQPADPEYACEEPYGYWGETCGRWDEDGESVQGRFLCQEHARARLAEITLENAPEED